MRERERSGCRIHETAIDRDAKEYHASVRWQLAQLENDLL
jgi:hypothetical protein